MENENLRIQEAAEKHLSARREQLQKELDEIKGSEKRTRYLAGMLESLPQKIKGRCEISFSGCWGKYAYANISPKFGKKFTEHDTLLITDWCATREKWEFKKEASACKGYWYHKLSRWTPDYEAYYEVIFNTISNIDGCELEEVEETRIVKTFKVKC